MLRSDPDVADRDVTGPANAAADAAPDRRRVACVDLNGVLDTYTGWIAATHFDPPRRGAREFLEALHARGFRVVVFTTRYAEDVWRWLRTHDLAALVHDVTDRKPPAFVFIDDRAVCFRGDFPATLAAVDAFAAHWEEHAEVPADSPRID